MIQEKLTFGPVAETKEQQGKAGIVEPKSEKNATDQANDGQAGADADTAQKKGKAKKEQPDKDYTPAYTEAEEAILKKVTDVCKAEIAGAHDKYGAVSFGNNSVLSLKECKKAGVIFATPKVNRTHGADQKTTGESLLSFGAQHPLLVITGEMADAVGIAYERFANDPDKDKPIPDDALVLVLLDGNGRINFLFTVSVEKWLDVWAVFPSPDAAGYYNIPRAFDLINTKVSVWKTQDLVSKRIMMDGSKAHEGFKKINALIKRGYKYQAASQLVTLGTDRLKKDEVNNGDVAETFKYFDCAEKIFKALEDKFGTDTDKVLQTKAIPMVVSTLWAKLRDKSGQDIATEHFVDFVQKLDEKVVSAIKTAKNVKGGASKDEQRKDALVEAFKAYVLTNNIELK